MSPKVSIERCDGYSPEEVMNAMSDALAPLGGIGAFVKPGQTVLLKPNLIHTKNAKNGSCTHPSIVCAAAQLVLQAGGKPIVGDSPGYLSAKAVADKAGLLEALKPHDVPVVEFDKSVAVALQDSSMFRDLRIARRVAEADVVINLPKMKTHVQMFLTLAVKNMFGAVVGTSKAQWHLKAGRNRDLFARMLLEVYRATRPCLNIMDGVIAVEGRGPTDGDPRKVGLLLASEDGIAMDVVVTKLLGCNIDDLPTTRVAGDLGIGETRLKEIEIVGASIDEIKVKDFSLPDHHVDLEFGPSHFRGVLKRLLTAKPAIDHSLCKVCGICAEHCPPRCIEENNGRVMIDSRECIRCFCCQEMCPQGAVSVKRSLLLNILYRIGLLS